MYELSDQEREGVLASSPDKQYKHFVTKAADWGEVWTLSNGETYANMKDVDGQDHFVVWPHRDYAEAAIVDEWKADGFEPELVEVHDFLGFCQRFEQDGCKVAILLNPGNGFVPTSAADLAEDLQAELDRIE